MKCRLGESPPPPSGAPGRITIPSCAWPRPTIPPPSARSGGPRVTNQLIREALHPYPESLHIVTKVGATRDSHGGWPPARQPEDLRRSVHENLETLGLEVIDL